MALDGNGIWQYQETDSEATASDLLNLGMGSVSDRVGDLQAGVDAKQDDLGDTGWVPVEIEPGFAAHSGFEPHVRRIGKQVYFRGGGVTMACWQESTTSRSARSQPGLSPPPRATSSRSVHPRTATTTDGSTCRAAVACACRRTTR